MATFAACISESGCVEPLPQGDVGQVVSQLTPTSVGWTDPGDLAISPPTGYTATTLQELLEQLAERQAGAATVRGNYAIAARPSIAANTYTQLTFNDVIHETTAGMGQATGVRASVSGYYDIHAWVDFDDVTADIRVGFRIPNIDVARTHMTTISNFQRTRLSGIEPGVLLVANQLVTLEAWTQDTAVTVIDAKLGLRLLQSS